MRALALPELAKCVVLSLRPLCGSGKLMHKVINQPRRKRFLCNDQTGLAAFAILTPRPNHFRVIRLAQTIPMQ
jgi:hypothetical protein